ncbi:hypothetical protein Cdeb_00588 [Caldibacillus debilis GB1]|uniref:Uncharacterized protein n=1 Tax=Caldibacillus debilis GB1 TaxID=1339248 RepID=A0A420VHH2_9BACI|nr:hypothetical protein Cdeb_00588 [Caldibacillus debilis GB1]
MLDNFFQMLNRSGTILDKPVFRKKRMLDHLPEMLNKTERMLNIWEKMWNDRDPILDSPAAGTRRMLDIWKKCRIIVA